MLTRKWKNTVFYMLAFSILPTVAFAQSESEEDKKEVSVQRQVLLEGTENLDQTARPKPDASPKRIVIDDVLNGLNEQITKELKDDTKKVVISGPTVIGPNEINNYISGFKIDVQPDGRVAFYGVVHQYCAESLKVSLETFVESNQPNWDPGYHGLKVENTNPAKCNPKVAEICKRNPGYEKCTSLSDAWADNTISLQRSGYLALMSVKPGDKNDPSRVQYLTPAQGQVFYRTAADQEAFEQHQYNLDLCVRASEHFEEDAITELTKLGILDEDTIADLKNKADLHKHMAKLDEFENRAKNISLTSHTQIEKLIEEIEDYAYALDSEDEDNVEEIEIKSAKILVKLAKRLYPDRHDEEDDDRYSRRKSRHRTSRKAKALAMQALAAARRLDRDNDDAQERLAKEAHKEAVIAAKSLNYANFQKREYQAREAYRRLNDFMARTGNTDPTLETLRRDLGQAAAISKMERPQNPLVPFVGKINPRDGQAYGTAYRKLFQMTVEDEFNRYAGLNATVSSRSTDSYFDDLTTGVRSPAGISVVGNPVVGPTF